MEGQNCSRQQVQLGKFGYHAESLCCTGGVFQQAAGTMGQPALEKMSEVMDGLVDGE